MNATIRITELVKIGPNSYGKGQEVHVERDVPLAEVDEYVAQCHRESHVDGELVLVEVML